MSGIPHDHYEPKTKAGKWFHDRLPAVNLVYDTLMIPTPKNLNWWWIWGIVLTFCLVMMIVTGLILAMHYNVGDGFASVQHIDRNVNSGAAFRDVHMNGASLFFFAVYIHIFRGLFYGSYKAPREVTWIVGIVIFLMMMATAFMGYTLPQGQMSLHGTSVITGLFGTVPVVGGEIKAWLLGGGGVAEAAYNRFFALHFLLPFVIAALVAVHIWAFHTTGNNNPAGVEVRRASKAEAEKDTLPFWPFFVIKDLVALCMVLTLFSLVIWTMPDYLGHPDNYIEGNPFVTPKHIVPEWYFLPFYAMLRAITFDFLFLKSDFLGFLVMIGSILIMMVAPWTDSSKVRSGRFRPAFKWFFWILVVDFIFLMWAGSQSTDMTIGPIPVVLLALLGTVYWFAYFVVILPLLGMFEKTKPIPATIEADFDAKYGAK